VLGFSCTRDGSGCGDPCKQLFLHYDDVKKQRYFSKIDGKNFTVIHAREIVRLPNRPGDQVEDSSGEIWWPTELAKSRFVSGKRGSSCEAGNLRRRGVSGDVEPDQVNADSVRTEPASNDGPIRDRPCPRDLQLPICLGGRASTARVLFARCRVALRRADSRRVSEGVERWLPAGKHAPAPR
jgi:hypothetical protein